ncbi:hypothetical protein D3C72_1945920 [compost metagenome]
MLCSQFSPVERAASAWPRGTDRMPAQKISSAKAASTSDRDSQQAMNADIDRLM